MNQVHTDKQYEEELNTLKSEILRMSGLVENMLQFSMKALYNSSIDLAQEVVRRDYEVDRLQIQIDELCLKLLALRQPAASDLRFITMGLRISNDLERIGDLASNIAKKVIKLINHELFRQVKVDLSPIAEGAQTMLRDTLDAFVNKDADSAHAVCKKDDEIDTLNKEQYHQMIRTMESNPSLVVVCLHYLAISRHFERVADHATNIAEEVVFMVKGEDIRHKKAI